MAKGQGGECPYCNQYVQLDDSGDLKEHSVYVEEDNKFVACSYQGSPK